MAATVDCNAHAQSNWQLDDIKHARQAAEGSNADAKNRWQHGGLGLFYFMLVNVNIKQTTSTNQNGRGSQGCQCFPVLKPITLTGVASIVEAVWAQASTGADPATIWLTIGGPKPATLGLCDVRDRNTRRATRSCNNSCISG